MKVLITGGAGYIGSVVAETFVHAGCDVIVFDNLSTGHRDAVQTPARLVEGDLLDTARVAQTLRAHAVDAVVHMAAESVVADSMREPARYYRSNVTAGLSLLEAMRDAGTAHLVFSSSAAVYGQPDRWPIDEEAPLRPTNPYGQTKHAFEQALPWYEHAYGLRSTSLRYFNAAGASAVNGERHEPETHLLPLALQAAAHRRGPLIVNGTDYATPDGTCVRDYVHVCDLAHAHVLAARALLAGGPSRVYNLGCGGAGYSVRQVIDAVQVVTGLSVPFVVGPRRVGDPAILVASSTRVRRELAWAPERQDLHRMLDDSWRFMQRRHPRLSVRRA